jgi:hypothetical protein
MIGKLRVHMICDIDIPDQEELEEYEAETLEEAAENIKTWWQDDSSLVTDASDSFKVIRVEVINQ